MEADYDTFHDMLRQTGDPAVGECREQDWRHVKGTEWLAAHPLFVLSLHDILQSAIDPGPTFHPHNGAFDVSEKTSTNQTDAFTALPYELRMELLSYLDSRDIANLRLVSRSFHQLPISLFHSLILRELPWLWEAWPADRSMPYSPWASMTSVEVKAVLEQRRRAYEDIADYVHVIGEQLPELKPQLGEVEAQALENIEYWPDLLASRQSPFILPQGQTNWFMLYTLLSRHMRRGELKGLRNRRRIWKQCEEILRLIDGYRDVGVEFPVRDVDALLARREEEVQAARVAYAEQRRKDEERAEEERRRAEAERQRVEQESENTHVGPVVSNWWEERARRKASEAAAAAITEAAKQ